MQARTGIRRKAHFLGTKIKSLRKRNNLTLEDLSVRCIQEDAEAAPSQLGNQAHHQGGLAAAAVAGDAENPHGGPTLSRDRSSGAT